MAKRKPAVPRSVYRLKITLRDTQPPICRRIEVPDSVRLDHLNLMVQSAMGWTNSHLHEFVIADERFGMRHDDFDNDLADEKEHHLSELIQREKAKFRYVYDFGDGWEHDIVVEKITAPEPGVKYPRCTAGARACPPEDCGGPWGYLEFLAAIADPEHEEHESMLEWIGGSFDPEAFDLAEADAATKDYKSIHFGPM